MFKQPADNSICPLLGGKPCIQRACKFWVHFRGSDPRNPDRDVDLHDCAVSWLPVMLHENAKQTRQAGAAVESFRNEVVKQNDAMLDFAAFAYRMQVWQAGGADGAPPKLVHTVHERIKQLKDANRDDGTH